MRNVIAALALVVAGQAAAQGLNPYPPGQKAKSKNTVTTLLDIAFSSPGCVASGTPTGLTFSRNTTATYIDGSGVVQTCSADTYRVAGSDGILIEESRSNLLPYSEAINSWGTGGLNSVAVVAGAAPDGVSAAYALKEDGGGPYEHRVFQFIPVTTANPTFSVFVKAGTRSWVKITDNTYHAFFNVTGSGSVGSVSSGASASITALANGWFRCSVYLPNKQSGYFITASNVDGNNFYTGVANDIALYLWGAMLEYSPEKYASSYVKCVSTPCVRGADVARIDTPTLTANWTLSGDFKKRTSAPWTSGTLFALDADTTDGGNNSSALTMGASNLVWTVTDNTPTSRAVTVSTPGYSAGSSQTFATKNSNGTLTMTCAGSSCGTASGTLNAFSSNPTYLYLGRKSDSTDHFNGFIKNLKVTTP